MNEIVKKKLTFNPSLVAELAENLCTHYLHAFREVCSNAYDIDAERVDIGIAETQMDFEDSGAGTGIKDVDQFLDKGSPYKQTLEVTPVFKRKVIGSKGLGSLSTFKLGSRVDVVSNNGKEGHYLSLCDKSLDVDYRYYYNPNDALPHKGTRITVRDLKRSAEPEEVRKYLARTFQLLLSNDFRILVNEQEVKPPHKLRQNVDIDTTYGKITGALEKKGGQINIFLCGVYVKGEAIDTNRLASGYVNVDFLMPTTDREDFVRDNDQWREFSSKLRLHIATNYPPRREAVSKSFRRLLKNVAKRLTRAVTKARLPVEGATPTSEETGEISEISDISKKQKKKKEIEEKELVRIKEKKKRERVRLDRFQAKLMKKVIGKPIRTGFGLKIQTANLGEKARPVVPVLPNTVVVNMENQITKILHEGKQYKPREAELLLTRLVMEAYADLAGKYPGKKEFLELTDRLMLESLRE